MPRKRPLAESTCHATCGKDPYQLDSISFKKIKTYTSSLAKVDELPQDFGPSISSLDQLKAFRYQKTLSLATISNKPPANEENQLQDLSNLAARGNNHTSQIIQANEDSQQSDDYGWNGDWETMVGQELLLGEPSSNLNVIAEGSHSTVQDLTEEQLTKSKDEHKSGTKQKSSNEFQLKKLPRAQDTQESEEYGWSGDLEQVFGELLHDDMIQGSEERQWQDPTTAIEDKGVDGSGWKPNAENFLGKSPPALVNTNGNFQTINQEQNQDSEEDYGWSDEMDYLLTSELTSVDVMPPSPTIGVQQLLSEEVIHKNHQPVEVEYEMGWVQEYHIPGSSVVIPIESDDSQNVMIFDPNLRISPFSDYEFEPQADADTAHIEAGENEDPVLLPSDGDLEYGHFFGDHNFMHGQFSNDPFRFNKPDRENEQLSFSHIQNPEQTLPDSPFFGHEEMPFEEMPFNELPTMEEQSPEDEIIFGNTMEGLNSDGLGIKHFRECDELLFIPEQCPEDDFANADEDCFPITSDLPKISTTISSSTRNKFTGMADWVSRTAKPSLSNGVRTIKHDKKAAPRIKVRTPPSEAPSKKPAEEKRIRPFVHFIPRSGDEPPKKLKTVRNGKINVREGGTLQPFVRPSYPFPVPDDSPILDISSKTVLITCFRVDEAIKALSSKPAGVYEIIVELYARVVFSERIDSKQIFQFADMFHDKPPFISGTYARFNTCGLCYRDSARFLKDEDEDRLARVVGCLQRKPGQKLGNLHIDIMSIYKVGMDDVAHGKGIICGR